MPTFKILNIADPGSSIQYGGDDLDKVNRYLNGENLDPDQVTIDTKTNFKSSKLILFDTSSNNYKIGINTSTETSDVNLFIPSLNGINQEIVTSKSGQTIENKTINAMSGGNNIIGLSNTNIDTNAAISWSKIDKSLSKISDLADTSIDTTPATGDSIVWDGSQWVNATAGGGPGGGGEVNTASNVGSSGIGIFKQKTLYDLQFKKLNAASAKVTIQDDTANSRINIDFDTSGALLSDFGGSVTNSQIGNLAVGTTKLADASVTADKLASNAVDASKIVDLSITNAEISNSAGISWAKISKTSSILDDIGDVSLSSLTANDVLSWNGTVWYNAPSAAVSIPDGSIATLKLADGAVTLVKMAANSVDASKIVDLSITNTEISSTAAIGWAKISKSGSVLADIADTYISSKVSGDVLTWNGTYWRNQQPNFTIADYSVTLSKLASNSVDSTKIVDGSITNTEISNSASISWSKVSKGGSSLNDFYDINIGTKTSGDVLTWSGSYWINQAPGSGGGGSGSGVNPYYGKKWGLVQGGVPAGYADTRIGTGLCVQALFVHSGTAVVTSTQDTDGTCYQFTSGDYSAYYSAMYPNASYYGGIYTRFNASMYAKLKINGTSNVCWFLGLTTSPSTSISNAYDNVLGGLHGFGFGYNSARDSTLRAVTNNGAGTNTIYNTGVSPSGLYDLIFKFSSSGSRVDYWLNSTALYSTSSLPSSTANLNYMFMIQAESTSNNSANLYYMYIETDK